MGHLSVTGQHNKYTWVVIDPFRKTYTAATTAKLLLKILSQWGMPHTIDSDPALALPEYTRAVLGIRRRSHTAWRPTASHLLKHISCPIKEALRKQCKANGKNWGGKLCIIFMAL